MDTEFTMVFEQCYYSETIQNRTMPHAHEMMGASTLHPTLLLRYFIGMRDKQHSALPAFKAFIMIGAFTNMVFIEKSDYSALLRCKFHQFKVKVGTWWTLMTNHVHTVYR